MLLHEVFMCTHTHTHTLPHTHTYKHKLTHAHTHIHTPGFGTTGPLIPELFVTAEKGGIAKAKVEGEKKKDCQSRRRRDEKAPWAPIVIIITYYS